MSTFESPHWLTDEQLKTIGIDKSNYEMYRRYHYQQAFGVQAWYDNIKEYTFETVIVQLEREEVLALLRVNRSISRRTSLLHFKTISKDDLNAIQIQEEDTVRKHIFLWEI